MRSEGSPFIVLGSGGWTLVRLQLVVALFSRGFSCRFRDVFRDVNSVAFLGKAAKPRSGVAMSMGKAAKPSSLLLLWRPRVYGGSCKTSFVLLRSSRRVYGGSCISSGVSVCMGEAAKPPSLLALCFKVYRNY